MSCDLGIGGRGLTRGHGRNGAPREAVLGSPRGFKNRLTQGATCLSRLISCPQLFASHTAISFDTLPKAGTATSQGREGVRAWEEHAEGRKVTDGSCGRTLLFL